MLRLVMSRRLLTAELTAEIGRQLTAFEQATGSSPDFIDGHQHVHALPIVRAAFLTAIREKNYLHRPLIRDPADGAGIIIARGAAVGKSLTIAALSQGFGAFIRKAGFPTNDGFSGVSTFDRRKLYGLEMERFLRAPGRLQLVMCHPGHVDAELSTLDPVSDRRAQEFEALMAYPDLPARLWNPRRLPSGAIDWDSSAVAHG